MTLSEFFFVKLWIDSDLVCIGELQLLWMDKNSDQVLSSLRLYFLPENTPEGRMDHGEVSNIYFVFYANISASDKQNSAYAIFFCWNLQL